MPLSYWLTSLESTSFATAIRESTWLFPTIESLHVLCIVLVVGSIMVVDLRLLNLASRARAVTELTAEVLPFTWCAFVCAAITGGLLFSSSAVKYSQNTPFRIKMVLLLVAAINMAIFHLGIYRTVQHWDRAPRIPFRAKLGGGLSLVLWIAVIASGRWIGFV